MNVLDSFLAKCVRDPDTECWEWLASKSSAGYPTFRGLGAHRFSYARFIGPIPPRHEVHHRCRNIACVNPEHLEAMTRRQHGQSHLKAHCPAGHAYPTEYPYMTGGVRRCKTCAYVRNRKWQKDNKEYVNAYHREWYATTKEKTPST